MATKTINTLMPLVVIVGPTASGKTGLAVSLAEEFDGEIISADSRAIYKGLDIGTAKPSREEQEAVPHWGIDLVAPGERFTAAEFKQYAYQKIGEIRSRGRTPFLVGGTGLYVDAVLYDFDFAETKANLADRNKYGQMSLAELIEYCSKNNINLPENYKNKRYIINNILRNGRIPKCRKQVIDNAIVVGITTEKSILQQRIAARAAIIFQSGVIEEARQAGDSYGWDNEAMTGNIYPLIRKIIHNQMTLEAAQEKFCTLDWRLAKRQLTWFRRSEHIRWLSLEEAHRYIAQELARLNK